MSSQDSRAGTPAEPIAAGDLVFSTQYGRAGGYLRVLAIYPKPRTFWAVDGLPEETLALVSRIIPTLSKQHSADVECTQDVPVAGLTRCTFYTLQEDYEDARMILDHNASRLRAMLADRQDDPITTVFPHQLGEDPKTQAARHEMVSSVYADRDLHFDFRL